MNPRRRVGWVCLVVGCVVAGWALLAVPARATYGARTTADEPQYLLSALSLAEDRDLWIDDELAAIRYRPFHELPLPVQTEPLDNGHAVSPHDPLLPLLLAVPMGLGGWAAAKVALAALAGVLAALLTWTAHRRLAVPLGVAASTVLAFGLAAPLSAYATQVYPELPAALAVTVVIAATLGVTSAPRDLGRGWTVAGMSGVVALPWLGVKYAPVAAVLALILLVRLWRSGRLRTALWGAAGLGVAGVGYLVAHRLIYGGWTVYAAGDHFVGGELTVVGNDANYFGRTRRLLGLLLDRQFGLAAWMPGYLLAVPALAALLGRRRLGPAAARGSPPGRTGVPDVAVVLVGPLAAGWATATWVALTMHGWWWPGRQTVVVLPCIVLVVAWWVGQARPAARFPEHEAGSGRRRRSGRSWWSGLWSGAWRSGVGSAGRPADGRPGAQVGVVGVVVAGVVGAVTWLWLVVEALGERRTLIVDFDTTSNPLYRGWRVLLPDYRHPDPGDWALQGVWIAVLALAAWAAARRAGRPSVPAAGGPGAGGGSEARAAAADPIDLDSDERRRPTHVPA